MLQQPSRSRSSEDSSRVLPGRAPSSTSAWRIQFVRQDSEIPKSFAIWESFWPGSRFLATRTTSSRNSWGYGAGMVHILPCDAAQRYRSCDTYPRISPHRMEAAATTPRLLEMTPDPVAEIARRVGLAEPLTSRAASGRCGGSARRPIERGIGRAEDGLLIRTAPPAPPRGGPEGPS